MDKFVIFVSTGAYSGFISKRAPGTIGTLVGIIIYLAISPLSPLLFALTVITLFFLGSWASHNSRFIYRDVDPKCVVIDEIVGYLVTMFLIPKSWLNIFMGFVFFRFFDVVKVFPIRKVERIVSGGYGILLDDVLAGVYSNIFLNIFIFIKS